MNFFVTICLSVVLLCSGCMTKKKVNVDGTNKGDFIEVVKQPGYSVNLIKKEIPQHLKDLEVVYQAPVNCDAYSQELSILDELLGEDPIDKPDAKNNAFTLHIGQILERQVSSSIPFNSVIESLSGAKKYEKSRLSAFVRGQARRSFLTGWAQGKECEKADQIKE